MSATQQQLDAKQAQLIELQSDRDGVVQVVNRYAKDVSDYQGLLASCKSKKCKRDRSASLSKANINLSNAKSSLASIDSRISTLKKAIKTLEDKLASESKVREEQSTVLAQQGLTFDAVDQMTTARIQQENQDHQAELDTKKKYNMLIMVGIALVILIALYWAYKKLIKKS